MKNTIVILLFASSLSCAPVIYNIDRQTIMEEDASGDWPDVEKKLTQAALQKGPTFFAKDVDSKSKKKLQSILNGELSDK